MSLGVRASAFAARRVRHWTPRPCSKTHRAAWATTRAASSLAIVVARVPQWFSMTCRSWPRAGVVLALAAITGCSDGLHELEWSKRELLIREGDDASDSESATPPSYLLINAEGERRPLPIEMAETAGWALDGDVLLARTTIGEVWGWSWGDEPPWRLYSASVIPGTSQYFQVAPGGQYASITNLTDSVPGYGVTVIDVLGRGPISEPLGCTTAPGVGWVGEGPEFLTETDECGCCGMPTPFTVTHVRPGGEDQVLVAGVVDAPQIDSNSVRRHATVAADGRWQLYELRDDEDVLLLDEATEDEYQSWSPDSTRLARVDGTRLVVHEPGGKVRWQGELPGVTKVDWSPVDARFVAHVECDDGRRRLVLVDPTQLDATELLGCEELSLTHWTPRGDALISTSDCKAGVGTLDWLDPSTGERRRMIDAKLCSGGGQSWSPDDSTYVAYEACDEGQWRARFFDADGHPSAEGPCDRYSDGAWSPDSDVVALTRNGSPDDVEPPHVHLLRVDGSLRDLGPGVLAAGVNNGWRPGPPRDR